MDKFQKKLSSILSRFNNASEWSDLNSILKDLNSLLDKFSEENIELSAIKDKIILSKRLAQCLNPLLPSGLHEITLTTYDKVLSNIMDHNNNSLGEDLALYSSGLFPFFQNASVQNKQKFLTLIIQNKFKDLSSTELRVCLTGLLVSILPAIEEQNEDNSKLVKEIFQDLRIRLSDAHFFGCLWSIILRNEHLRQSGMRYINEVFPSYKEYEAANDKDKEKIKEDYYPQLSPMVLNAISSVIEDTEIQNQRLGMDFLIKCMPITCDKNLLTDDQKITLLVSAFNLLVKNEYSTTRRLSQWILGNDVQDDEIDFENPQIKYEIELIVKTFKTIFSPSNYNLNKDKLIRKIKIVEQFFNQQVQMITPVLDEIAYDIIKEVVYYWIYALTENELSSKNEIINKTNLFFSRDPSSLEALWISLAKNLETLTNTNSNETSTLNDDFLKPLKFCLLYVNITSNDTKIRFYIPIISNLLKLITRFTINGRKDIEKIKQIIFVTLVFVKSLQDKDTDTEEMVTRQSIFLSVSTATETNLLEQYDTISNIIKSRFNIIEASLINKILSLHKNDNSDINELSKTIIEFQNYYITFTEELMKIPNFKGLLDDQETISRREINIFRQATEIIIRLQEYAQQNEIPKWLFSLEKVCFCANNKLSLESASYIIDLLLMNENKNSIYQMITSYLKTEKISNDVINQELCDRLTKSTFVKDNCMELLFARLWGFLSLQEEQQRVINLLITLSKVDGDIFIQTISNTFIGDDFDMNVNAIKLFTQFWKLTYEYYPQEVFFKNGECIFKMLDFLDHEHPLIRHLSKTWLNQCSYQYDKIFNPLLLILLSEDKNWKLDVNSHDIYFDKPYNNKRIMDAFRKLKNILLNTTAVNYLITNKVSNDIIKLDLFGKKLIDKEILKMPIESYLELMINISLRFIKVKIKGEHERSFSRENYSVNAASCEFLEFLLGFIEDKEQLMKIAIDITTPVVEILIHKIEGKDEVMQLQILNLLGALLLHTKDKHVQNKNKMITLLTNNTFMECLKKGLQIEYYTVRSNFNHFIESLLPIFTKLLSHPQLPENNKKLITLERNLIEITWKFLAKRIYQNKFHRKEISKFSYLNTKHNTFIFKNYLDEYKEHKRFDENDVLTIVKGMRVILFHFLNNPQHQLHKGDWVAFKKDILSTYKTSTNLIDYLSNLFSKEGFEENESEKDMTLSKEIYNNQLKGILGAFMIAWVNESGDYVVKDYCLSDIGILSYIEDFENVNTTETTGTKIEKRKQYKTQMLEIAFNIFHENPIDFIVEYLDLWVNIQKNQIIEKEKQYKLSMIEFLVNLKIPFHILLLTLSKWISNFEKKAQYTKSKDKNLQTPYPISLYECRFCQFLYAYILLNNNESDLNSQEIWVEMYTVLYEIVSHTKISYTLCWIYEVLRLMVVKYPIGKLDHNTKKNLNALVDSLNKKLFDISFHKKFDSYYEDASGKGYKIETPILPSIYSQTVYAMFPNEDLYMKRSETVKSQKESAEGENNPQFRFFREENSSARDENVNKVNVTPSSSDDKGPIDNFYHDYYQYIIKNKEIKCEQLQTIHRQLCFLTLRFNYYPVMKALHNDLSKQFALIIKQLITIMNNKEKDNLFFKELSTQFLENLASVAPSLTVNSSKQTIMDYFSQEQFFQTNRRLLRSWREIIKNIASNATEIIDNLMSLIDSGFFGGGNFKKKQRILRRISFIVYSCDKDTFSTKMNLFKEKVKDLFIDYDDADLESEVFLMMRVLFLRFSHDNVMEMIRSLWPIIFSELVSVLKNKRESPRIMLESFKFIELLSLANIEEFCLYQWIFILDTYSNENLDPSKVESLMKTLEVCDDKTFRPLAMNIWSKGEETTFIDECKHKSKSELVIFANSDQMKQYKELIKKFFYSIGDMNNYKVQVNYNQIENVIEQDFIELQSVPSK